MNILSILVCIRWLWLGGGSDYTIDSHPQPEVDFCLLAKEMELIKVLSVFDIHLYDMLALDLFYIRHFCTINWIIYY